MASTAKRLFGPAQLTGSAATKYTVPALTKTIIRHVHVYNPGPAAATFTMSIGADAAATRLYDAISIPLGTAFDWYPYAVVDAAEVIQAFSGTASQLVLTLFGDERTLG